MTGRVVYDRRIHLFSLKDVIRILKTLDFELRDIDLVMKVVEDFWTAFKRWLDGFLGWIRDKAGPWLVKQVIKFFVLEILYVFRYSYQWSPEDVEKIGEWISYIKKL